MSLDFSIVPTRVSDLFPVHALDHACFGRDALGVVDGYFEG